MKRFNAQLTFSALTLGLVSAVGLPSAPAQAGSMLISPWTISFNNYLSGFLSESGAPLTPTQQPTPPVSPVFLQTSNNNSFAPTFPGEPSPTGNLFGPNNPATEPLQASWGRQSFSAGVDTSCGAVAGVDPACKPSALAIDELQNVAIPTSLLPGPSTFVNIANIVHDNFTVNTGTSIGGLDYISELNFVNPALPGPLTAAYTFGFLETLNSSNHPDDIWYVKNINVGGDDVAIGSDLTLPLFDDPWYTYTFVLQTASPTGLRVLSDDECALVGQASGCVGFTTPENQQTKVSFFAQIDAVSKETPVPEPSASAALVGAGLISFGLLRKRKQSI